jgi:hypothetical protein
MRKLFIFDNYQPHLTWIYDGWFVYCNPEMVVFSRNIRHAVESADRYGTEWALWENQLAAQRAATAGGPRRYVAKTATACPILGQFGRSGLQSRLLTLAPPWYLRCPSVLPPSQNGGKTEGQRRYIGGTMEGPA